MRGFLLGTFAFPLLAALSTTSSAAPQGGLDADFTATPTSGAAPLTVRFAAQITGTASSGSWDFGDGGSAVTRNPAYTYSTPGTYTVSMTANGPSGSDTETKVGLIVVTGGGGGTEPVVDFSATPTTGPAPLTVQFTAIITGTVNSGSWDFGDGGSSTSANPSYTYTTPGTYTVSVTGSGPDGSDTETKVDYIVVDENSGGSGLTLDISADPIAGMVPLTVQFTADITGTVTGGSWSFGDGGTASVKDPSYTYTTPGTYTVSATANSATGSETQTLEIIVQETPGTVNLTKVNDSAGLDDMFTSGNSHTNGAAWIDYNGDFLPDLFITNGGGLEHRLYRNEGGGSFSNQSSLVAKPDLSVESAAAKFADIDNDGDSDLLVIADNPAFLDPFNNVNPPEGGPNMLYVNQGDGTFIENAVGAGVVDPLGRRNIAGAFADYDRDGLIDLYLANWELRNIPAGQVNPDRLLSNAGGGVFTDATGMMGTDAYGRDALTLIWTDVDMDMWPDLYIGNVGVELDPPNTEPIDTLYVNQGGTAFIDAIVDETNPIGTDAWANMGLDIGDIDNDGDWDLYSTDQSELPNPEGPLGNPLYLGNPDGSLTDNTCDVAGICAANSWPCNFADFNRDGWADLWVGGSFAPQPDYLFINDGDGTFTPATADAFIGNEARGGCIADYDGDGRIDLVVVNYQSDSYLIRNVSADTGGWLELKLIGGSSNRDAIGAVIRVTAGGITQMRRVSGGDSAHSQSDLIVHFGLGSETSASVTIDWPSGITQDLGDVSADQFLVVNEAAGISTEALFDLDTEFDPAGHRLDVSVRSNYGGRTGLEVEGLGALEYDAATTSFRASFEAAQLPSELVIRSARGGSWTQEVAPVTRD